jgi:hypothetical protein
VQNVLHGLIATQPASQGRPRILLTTAPGCETADARPARAGPRPLDRRSGAECVSLGPAVPGGRGSRPCAADGDIDVVALSLSLSFQGAQALAATLRYAARPVCRTWSRSWLARALGGRRRVEGVRILGPIEAAGDALATGGPRTATDRLQLSRAGGSRRWAPGGRR